MADGFDVQAMIDRFSKRAAAVKDRGIPPVEGPERQRFIAQAKVDYMDYAMIADSNGSLEEGILTLTIDLRADSPGT